MVGNDNAVTRILQPRRPDHGIRANRRLLRRVATHRGSIASRRDAEDLWWQRLPGVETPGYWQPVATQRADATARLP